MGFNAVAEKKKGTGKKGSDRPVVLLDPKLHRALKTLCAKMGVEMRDYVDNLVKPAVVRDYTKEVGVPPEL